MKIRLGYVSNSSSSSYCVDSTCFMGINGYTPGYNSIDLHGEKIINFIHNDKNEIFTYLEGDNRVIGINISDMKDDETKNQFRARVYEILKQLGYDGKMEDVDFQLPEYSGECD